MARLRPDWHLILVGPVVKIDPAKSAAGCQYSLPGRQAVWRVAGLYRELGCRRDAVRAQRGDPVYKSDKNTGISRRREAGGLYSGHRCRPALGPPRTRWGSPKRRQILLQNPAPHWLCQPLGGPGLKPLIASWLRSRGTGPGHKWRHSSRRPVTDAPAYTLMASITTVTKSESPKMVGRMAL